MELKPVTVTLHLPLRLGCFSMSKGDHLKVVGGTAAGDTPSPPGDIVDSPQSLCTRALALDPVNICIGVLDKDGFVTVFSDMDDEFAEVGFIQKMQQASQNPVEEDSA
jgi:hypothetical protein